MLNNNSLNIADCEGKLDNSNAISQKASTANSPYYISSQAEVKSSTDKPKTYVPLNRLLPLKQAELLRGYKATGTPADKQFARFYKEVVGWKNLAEENGYSTDNATDLAEIAGKTLGVDEEGQAKIIATIKPEQCKPRQQSKGTAFCIEKIERIVNPPPKPKPSPDTIYIKSTDSPGLLAMEHLYPDRHNYIEIADEVYHFAGTHFEAVNPGKRRQEIANLFERCVMVSGDESNLTYTRPYANDRHVSNAFNYSRDLFRSVLPEEMNPEGYLNCRNCVLKIEWAAVGVEGHTLSIRKLRHSPDLVFLDEPKVVYDPEADPTEKDRLFSVLEPEFHSIMKRALAAPISITKIKKELHRPVRILLCTGGGSNGKDSIKMAAELIYGSRAISSVGLKIFEQYDQGKRFGVTGLAGSRINWPSETGFDSTLDNLHAIKQVVTGEALEYERKHKDALPNFKPKCTLIFNGNIDSLKIIASSEAIRSRYATIPFRKTFTSKPDKNNPNSLQADPNFQNPDWLAENVCSALLNDLLKELQNLANEGIDYSSCNEVMAEHTIGSFHLARFIDDVGLIEDFSAKTEIGEIWARYLEWCEQEDFLYFTQGEAGKRKENWKADFASRQGDRLSKQKQHLSAQLVRHIESADNKSKGSRSNGKNYLVGVRFADASDIIAAKLKTCQNWNDYCRVASGVPSDVLEVAFRERLDDQDRTCILNWEKESKENSPQRQEDELDWQNEQASIDFSQITTNGVTDPVKVITEHLMEVEAWAAYQALTRRFREQDLTAAWHSIPEFKRNQIINLQQQATQPAHN